MVNEERKCIGCHKIKCRQNLIRIMRTTPGYDIVIKPDSKTFGRSAYLCYNSSCIEAAFKKNQISKVLRVAVKEQLRECLTNLLE
jgi:predicted RNA-binding protein YlxR (DUF448 family)